VVETAAGKVPSGCRRRRSGNEQYSTLLIAYDPICPYSPTLLHGFTVAAEGDALGPP